MQIGPRAKMIGEALVLVLSFKEDVCYTLLVVLKRLSALVQQKVKCMLQPQVLVIP